MMSFIVESFNQIHNDLLDFTDEIQTVVAASTIDLNSIRSDFNKLNETINFLKEFLPQAERSLMDDDNYYHYFNDFKDNNSEMIKNVDSKLIQTKELYDKTSESFGVEPDKMNYNEFIQSIATFINDFEGEKMKYIEENEMKNDEMKLIETKEEDRARSIEEKRKARIKKLLQKKKLEKCC